MEKEIQRHDIRQFEAFNVAQADTFKMFLDGIRGYIFFDDGIIFRLAGNQADIAGIPLYRPSGRALFEVIEVS